MKTRVCELCSADAVIYCASDSAFLCRSCDDYVHEANFLVARHPRQAVCSQCKGLTGNIASGSGLQFIHTSSAVCSSCSPDPSAGVDLDSNSATSSVCVSSTNTPKKAHSDRRKTCDFDSTTDVTSGKSTANLREINSVRLKSPTPTNVDWRAEGIFVNWSRKLELGCNDAVRVACVALRACLAKWTALPFRVCLAASMWLGLKFCCNRWALTWQALKRLEEMSGVPAKLIMVAESKLERLLKARKQHRRNHQLEEGWAECSA